MSGTRRLAIVSTKSREIILLGLLALDGLLLLLPKLVLIEFTNKNLWGDISTTNFVGAILQDVLVAIVAIAVALLIIRKLGWRRIAAGAILTGALLLVLMLDTRARELWLNPVDLALIRYGLNNAKDLTSGAPLFFNYVSGFDMTFRRLLFYVGLAHVAIWCAIGWVGLTYHERKGLLAVRRPIAYLGLAASLVLGINLVGDIQDNRAEASISFPHWFSAHIGVSQTYRYRINENILAAPFINAVLAPAVEEGAALSTLASGFDQKATPLSFERERRVLRDVRPFKNVVLIVYESVRWRGLDLANQAGTIAPTLARMASEGILSKCYVSVPHSSKSYFAILSGRIPYPAVEMREVMHPYQASIWHEFVRQRKGITFAFSSLFLGFENMGGELKALGIDHRFQTNEMAQANDQSTAASSSFGTSDELLYPSGAQRLSVAPQPFAAIFFPVAAHYPYDCPGSAPGRHGYEDYRACIKYSDTLLAKMIDEFRKRQLLEDTLFVLVGDHGESFGEHGLFVHNSSMYEEEVTVPLVFWSADGRLGHHALPPSRQIDIAPTIADLLGLAANSVPVQGTSILRRNEHEPDVYMATFFDGVGQALIEGHQKYVYEPSSDRLLGFDLSIDPEEMSPRTISGTSKSEIVARLAAFRAYQESSFSQR